MTRKPAVVSDKRGVLAALKSGGLKMVVGTWFY